MQPTSNDLIQSVQQPVRQIYQHKQTLVVWFSRTGASQALAQAAFEGAALHGPATIKNCVDTQVADMLQASAYIFVTPENLGSIAGEMKAFFDRSYYPLLDQIQGRPYTAIISAGSDGNGALRQIERIVTGWRLRQAIEPQIVNLQVQLPVDILAIKVVPEPKLSKAKETGALMGLGLQEGVY